VLLLGPSGCGKTTLLSVLAGILTPTSGQVLLDGRPVTGLRGEDLTAYRRSTVGVVFQAFNLVPSLSALENVAAPLWAAGVRRREARERATALLAKVDLTDRLTHRPGDLSGGQQQRVAIARALASRPAVIFADEPTGNLDSKASDDILVLLRRAVDEFGQTVVMVTHDAHAASYADQLVVLVDGQVVEDREAPDADEILDVMKRVA